MRAPSAAASRPRCAQVLGNLHKAAKFHANALRHRTADGEGSQAHHVRANFNRCTSSHASGVHVCIRCC